jgi:hypothetical protein
MDVRPLKSISQKSVEARLITPEDKMQRTHDAMMEHMLKNPQDHQMLALANKLGLILADLNTLMEEIIQNRPKR